MKYSFSLEKLILRRIPWALRKPNRIAWINSMHAYLFLINDKFKAFVLEVRYKLQINGQKIYLEHYLNDLFDDTQRRIYIDTNQLPAMLFTFKKQEVPAFFIAHIWKSTVTYNAGDKVIYGAKMYKALTTSTNRNPVTYDTMWEEIDESYYLTKADYVYANDFTIVFPSVILISTEFERHVRALIDPYVVAGKKYNLINS